MIYNEIKDLQDVDWGGIDYLIVDAPPGTSDEHISIAQYLKATQVDGAVIVTTPQEVSLIDVRKEINFCKKVITESQHANGLFHKLKHNCELEPKSACSQIMNKAYQFRLNPWRIVKRILNSKSGRNDIRGSRMLQS